ncbi:MAG: transcription termination factor NusA [Phycisphaerae bacterium]|nr:transcription termination factor NusA [Phycisphaerae bacterium]
MNHELIRLVDSISRDKNIDKELLYQDLELAMVSAAKKYYGQDEEFQIAIDRQSGEISAIRNGEPIDVRDLGRIAAQTAKQVMIQRIREAERGSMFSEFKSREGTIVTGSVTRVDESAITVNIGRGEGFLPRSEQIPGESHQVGERIRAMILEVRETPHQIKVVLSRSHPDFVRRLFELEVPEVAERIIEIKALAREAGYRTKIAVTSIDSKVDALGACVGVRGSRVNNIVDELGGERVDIVRWNESSQVLIGNALKPAEINQIALCFEMGRATVVVNEDQLSLAIGKRGQNVRLAARLTGWDIDILTPAEYNAGLDRMVKTLRAVEGISDEMLDKMIALGIVSLLDLEEVGAETLVENCGIPQELGDRVVTVAAEEAKKIQAEQVVNRERADAARREKAALEASWAKKLAAGEMSLEQVEAARSAMAAEEMERKAAQVGLGVSAAPLPEGTPVEVPTSMDQPLTLEQRLAMARQRDAAAQQQAQAAPAADPAPVTEPASAAEAAPAAESAPPASAPEGGENKQ